ALVVAAEDVAHVAGVLERRPRGGVRAAGPDGTGVETGPPPGGVRPDEHGDLAAPRARRVEPAVGARSIEHPRPVLVVGRDHRAHRRGPPRGRARAPPTWPDQLRRSP